MRDRKNTRDVYPPTGPELNAKSWVIIYLANPA